MMEQHQDTPKDLANAGIEAKPPRRLGALDCTTAEVLVHRRLLVNLLNAVIPAVFGQDGADKARRELHAVVAADVERARFLGSPRDIAESMRSHANAVLDKILIVPQHKQEAKVD
jgi:hypothetical protein